MTLREKQVFSGRIGSGMQSRFDFTAQGALYCKVFQPDTPANYILLRLLSKLPNDAFYNLPLGVYTQEFSEFNVNNLIPIPNEVVALGLECTAIASSRVPSYVEIWQIINENSDVIRAAAQIPTNPLVPNISMIAVNAVPADQDPRKGIDLVNPPTNAHPVYISYFHPVSPASYNYVINPGATLSLGAYQGELYGYCEQSISLMGTEFR